MTDPVLATPEEVAELKRLELALEVFELETDFKTFLPQAWPLVEPNRFVSNWHIDAIADHLSAISLGYITDLLITMPPRHSKSLLVSVLWPTWEWCSQPQNRWVFASYALGLSVRDSVKRRKVIQSQWYQQRWGEKFQLIKEQNTKSRFENDKHGFMLSSSVGGSNTGEGGERIVADDPHNIKRTESEDVRKDTVLWWNTVMSTRRNIAGKSARVVVQQRAHEGDVAGDIIERGGYVHLNLPTEFDSKRRCFTSWVEPAVPSGKDPRYPQGKAEVVHKWTDPRQEDGELLNPERFNVIDNEKAKIDLGDYQYAAQHAQDPTPPAGTIIKAEWLRYYGGPSTIMAVPDWTKSTNPLTPLLALDCAFKAHSDTDYVAGLVWCEFGANLYLMPYRIHARLTFTGTVDAIAELVGGRSLDGQTTYAGVYNNVKIKLVENKANGSAVIDTLQHRIPGFVGYEPGNNSKEARLQASSWRFRAGNVYLPHESIAPWIKEYVFELCAFPKAKRDDYVDATSMPLLWLGGEGIVIGTPMSPEHVSRWFNVGESNQPSSGTSSWGTVHTGGSKSIWRL